MGLCTIIHSCMYVCTWCMHVQGNHMRKPSFLNTHVLNLPAMCVLVNCCTNACVFRLRHIKRALSHQSDILRRQHLCVCEYGLWLQLVKHVSVTFENSDVLSPCKSGLIGPAAQTDYRKLPCQELISPLGFFRPPLLLGSSSRKQQWGIWSHEICARNSWEY